MTKATVAPLEERMATQKAALEAMEAQLKQQLNGVANQLYLIDLLEHPEKAEAQGDPETGAEGVPLEDGTV